MAVKYNKLLKLLIDKEISVSQLMDITKMSGNIATRIKRNEYISLNTVEKICNALSCGVDDILEFVPDKDNK